MKTKNKPELIAPAGDLEKLKIAYEYGADAVYGSTPNFSMRTRDIGFDYQTLEEGIEYAHSIGKKVYITLNIYPHPGEIENLKKHAENLIKVKPDAFIVADPGIIEFLKANCNIPLHLSTQANATNHLAISFWEKQGIERVVLARELSIGEISKINHELLTTSNKQIELEAFVHGSMCMAYSGRCQISNYLAGRDPNRGACVQACRFNYTLMESSRPGEYFPIFEDERGTHFFNSKDLCMIEHLPEMIESGVSSFKIEGRLKSPYYVATVTRAYRQAIDCYFENQSEYEQQKVEFKTELEKTSNRGYTTGFYFNKPNSETNNYESSRPESDWGYVGLITDYDAKSELVTIEGKNRVTKDMTGEFVTPKEIIPADLSTMVENGTPVTESHANHIFTIESSRIVPKNSFLRTRNN